jgi:hypothetical protein
MFGQPKTAQKVPHVVRLGPPSLPDNLPDSLKVRTILAIKQVFQILPQEERGFIALIQPQLSKRLLELPSDVVRGQLEEIKRLVDWTLDTVDDEDTSEDGAIDPTG